VIFTLLASIADIAYQNKAVVSVTPALRQAERSQMPLV
jgi:hypothetical protein